jgi:hypothetical protein
MISALMVPFAAAAFVGALARCASRRLPARMAIWLLSISSVAIVAGSWLVVGAVVATMFGQVHGLATLGGWTPGVVRQLSPFPLTECILAVVVVAALALRMCLVGLRDLRRLSSAWSMCRDATEPLLVLVDDARFAYAVPGWPGRIVASTGLLRNLDARQRRAVLAHEQAHLDQHHELHLVIARLVAAANPLLFRLPASMRLACERAADECAADTVDDRRTVAAVIMRVTSPVAIGVMALAAGGSDIPARVLALLSPPRRRRGWVIEIALLCAMVATAAATWWMYRDLDRIFDAAAVRR